MLGWHTLSKLAQPMTRLADPQTRAEFEAEVFRLMSAPVDPEIFIYMAGIFDAAARFVMPVPSARSLPPAEAATVALFTHADQSFNCGMQAVAGHLMSEQIDNAPGYLARLAMLPDLYNAASPIFSEFLADAPAEPGMLVVDRPLMQAAAVAKVYAARDGIGYDLGDVLARARQFAGRPDEPMRAQ